VAIGNFGGRPLNYGMVVCPTHHRWTSQQLKVGSLPDGTGWTSHPLFAKPILMKPERSAENAHSRQHHVIYVWGGSLKISPKSKSLT